MKAKPIVVESDEEMEPAEDESTQPGVISRVEAKLISDQNPAKEIEARSLPSQ
jgi:hypothetical protein